MIYRIVCFWFCFALTLGIDAAPAHAHPHVWVDYYVDAVGGKDGIEKLIFRWHFDDMFTSMVKEDFHIQSMTPENVVTLRDSAFANLKNYHYYIYIRADGVEFDPQIISGFDARLVGHNLEYMFSVDLPHPAKKLEVELYDPEFYVDIGPPIQSVSADQTGIMAAATMKPKDFVSSSGSPAPVCSWHMGDPRISPVWGKFALFVVTCEAK